MCVIGIYQCLKQPGWRPKRYHCTYNHLVFVCSMPMHLLWSHPSTTAAIPRHSKICSTIFLSSRIKHLLLLLHLMVLWVVSAPASNCSCLLMHCLVLLRLICW